MIEYADNSLKQTRASEAASAARSLSNIIAWSFGAVLFLPLVGGAFSLIFWQPSFGGAAAAIVLFILLITGATARRLRRKRSRIILSYLFQVVHLQLPLSPMLKAAAEGELRGAAKRLYRVRAAIEDGASMGNALLLAVPQTPLRVVDLVNAGERNGCLSSVLKRLLDESVESQGMLELPAFIRTYGLILLATVGAVILLIDTFVMPKFQQILHDFHTTPPYVMGFMIGAGQVIAPLVVLVCAVMIVISAGAALRQLLSRAAPYANPLKPLFDQLIWRAPIAGSMARDHGLADVFGVVANGMDAGRPAEDAIRSAGMPHLNAVLKCEIEMWADRIETGDSLHDAAAQAGLPQIVVGMLASGVRSGNLPAVLRLLQRHYSLRFSRIEFLIRGAAVPFLTLIAGTIVLITAAGIFGPIIALIQSVSYPVRAW